MLLNKKQINNYSLSSKASSHFKLHHYVSFFGLALYLVMFSFAVYEFVEYANKESWKIFFGIIDRFTWQSNFLLLIYTTLVIFRPNHSIFKNNRFLIMVMSYILFTFSGYNIVLILISGQPGYVGSVFEIVRNAWVHIICPIYFIFYGFVYMIQNPQKYPDSFIKTLGYGIIYPAIYALYLITIPYIFDEYINNWAYFGNVKQEAYSVYGNATNTKQHPISYAYIFCMLVIFIPLFFASFYYSWVGIYKYLLKYKRR